MGENYYCSCTMVRVLWKNLSNVLEFLFFLANLVAFLRFTAIKDTKFENIKLLNIFNAIYIDFSSVFCCRMVISCVNLYLLYYILRKIGKNFLKAENIAK